MGQNGARFVIPPFFDPPNPNIPPLILREVGLIGYKIAADLQAARIRGRGDEHDVRYLVARRFSLRAVLPQFNRHLRSGERESDVARRRHARENAAGARRARFSVAARNRDESSASVAAAKLERGRHRGDGTPRVPLGSANGGEVRAGYLRSFYELNRVNSQENANPNQPAAYVIPAGQGREEIVSRFVEILLAQGVEVYRMTRELHASIPRCTKARRKFLWAVF
jgi:hypothetical protein